MPKAWPCNSAAALTSISPPTSRCVCSRPTGSERNFPTQPPRFKTTCKSALDSCCDSSKLHVRQNSETWPEIAPPVDFMLDSGAERFVPGQHIPHKVQKCSVIGSPLQITQGRHGEHFSSTIFSGRTQ